MERQSEGDLSYNLLNFLVDDADEKLKPLTKLLV